MKTSIIDSVMDTLIPDVKAAFVASYISSGGVEFNIDNSGHVYNGESLTTGVLDRQFDKDGNVLAFVMRESTVKVGQFKVVFA